MNIKPDETNITLDYKSQQIQTVDSQYINMSE